MIIGGSKKDVIEHIKSLTEKELFNDKAELTDPVLSSEELNNYLNKFYKNNHGISHFFKNKIIYNNLNKIEKKLDIKIKGDDILKDINLNKGAIITCNHFNPLDSLPILKLAKSLNKKLYVVIQDTNLALPEKLGFLMNNMNSIPITNSPSYINNIFIKEIKKVLDKGNLVLIYPEQEMWFNYRKPRPFKRGAYQFAYMLDVPIISLFTKITSSDKDDNEEFYETGYELNVLGIIKKDDSLPLKSGAITMMNKDYELKKGAYEHLYNKKLDYKFSYDDIAGFKY